jgi:Fe-S cluster biosynthesis and repair protein YggX
MATIMARTINCVKLKREAEGLDYAPYPGELGARIWREISKEAWIEWTQVQTRLVNENRLNLADARARKYLREQMVKFLFEDGSVEAQGFVPPSA